MKKQLIQIPVFKNEDAEREFWAKADSSEYFDWSKTKKVIFPNLKLSTKSISLRLPESMINELKVTANKRDVPYQSLIKNFIAEKLRELKQSIAQTCAS